MMEQIFQGNETNAHKKMKVGLDYLHLKSPNRKFKLKKGKPKTKNITFFFQCSLKFSNILRKITCKHLIFILLPLKDWLF